MFDVAVVGAGPAGLEVARQCSEALDVVILEEHKKIGGPNHCSGLISRNIDSFERPRQDCIEHKVRGAVLHSPGGGELVLKKPEFAAYVVDREKFDRQVAEGVECGMLMGSRLSSIKFGKDAVALKTKSKTIRAKCVVGADGSSSRVGAAVGARPREKVPGIMAITDEEDCGDFVELWFDKSITDCFLWKIPRGGTTEYGMWGSGSRFDVLEKFFGIGGMKCEKRGGVIPLGPPKTYFNRCILVGDAAAQVKPWSGGGVVWGMMCAGIAADALNTSPSFSESGLSRYQREWKHAIGKQLAAGMFMRRLYARSSNSQIDALMKTAGYMKLLNRLDMDFIVGSK
jgi:geranylgeranyl reductase family protein